MERIDFGKWSAVIAPECGSNVISLTFDGKAILRCPEGLEQLRSRPCLYGMPLLLPANRLADACFSFAGRTYQLPENEPTFGNHIHGLVKDAPFHIIEKTENSVTTQLENTGAYFPFPFEITICDSLSGEGFCRKLSLKNTGSSPMPYTLGFHTAFVEPTSFCVPLKDRWEMDARYLPTGHILPLTARQKAYCDGIRPNGSKISGVYRSDGHTVHVGGISMQVSEQFDHWVLFNGNGNEGYLCIEPQCGAVNGLNNGNYRILEPGKQEAFTVSLFLRK